MKYSIITPTYNRPELLKRAVDSVLEQSYTNYEIIVVNDSPDFDYSSFENSINENSQIKYFKNEKNMGVNFSRNFALKNVSKDSDYVIFLDDDDYLNTNALRDMKGILEKENIPWLLTNRVTIKNGILENLTKIKSIKNKYSYFFDYVLFKNISGDATHVIKTDIAKSVKFSKKVKNGEEWIYFLQLDSPITHKDLDSTVSDGYLAGGLTDQLKSKYIENTKILWSEICNNTRLLFNCKIVIYMILRTIRNLI